MNPVLCIHNRYTHIESALADDQQIFSQVIIAKENASAQLIPTIANLLCSHNYQLSDLSYIIANQGPAPFTTLRTLIVTANGIAFAHKTPLVGVNALDAFIAEYADKVSGPLVILLNAFNNAVYYGIADPAQDKRSTGYAPLASCIAMIKELFPDMPILFLGNGTQLYRKELESVFGSHAQIPDPLPLTPSLEQILITGLELIKTGRQAANFLEPLYLKKPLS